MTETVVIPRPPSGKVPPASSVTDEAAVVSTPAAEIATPYVPAGIETTAAGQWRARPPR